ncbi:hypothetical protein Tco_0934517 [Tanacetum coccineum]
MQKNLLASPCLGPLYSRFPSLEQQLSSGQGKSKNQATKDFVAPADTTKSLDASESPKVQENQPKTADAIEVLELKIMEMEEKEAGDTSADLQELSDSELSDMPDDDLHSTSVFDTVNSGNDKDDAMAHSEQHSDDISAYNVHASADLHGLHNHLDHVCEEVSLLHSTVADIETSIISKVSDI